MLMLLVEHFFDAPGRERFAAWVQAIGAAASQSPGFVDIRQLTRVDEPERSFFLLSFATPADAQRWVASAARQELLDEMAPYRLKPQEGVRWLAGESWSAAHAVAPPLA
jgi:antibiotic biosynthesis monooxygenase (ABM) superfamily enzyme